MESKKDTKETSFKMTIIVFTLLLYSCVSTRGKDNIQEPHLKAVEHFIKKYKPKIKDNIFDVSNYKTQENVEMFFVNRYINKVILDDDGYGMYPEKYYLYGDDLFFIGSKFTNTPKNDVYTMLKKHNLIDSTFYKLEKGMIKFEDLSPLDGKDIYDDKEKGAIYVICLKSNKILQEKYTNSGRVYQRMVEMAKKTKRCN
ncbi:hypothetical protein AB4865_11565 [Capnocytophaga sp. ARDL2]|uniref:hypothetical protein n=1 Tax=Capnocytophaga sp. ARDL2 TaxID=3238809 RepID=UPI0035588388